MDVDGEDKVAVVGAGAMGYRPGAGLRLRRARRLSVLAYVEDDALHRQGEPVSGTIPLVERAFRIVRGRLSGRLRRTRTGPPSA